jgi:hypothetical protein
VLRSEIQSNFDKREGIKHACRIIPSNVADPACETGQNT